MDGKTRRTRFEQRIQVERKFLSKVNAVFGSNAPLAGMTLDAIDTWETRAAKYNDAIWVARISALLREASTKAMLLADNSKDVFEPSKRPKRSSVSTIAEMLDDALLSGV